MFRWVFEFHSLYSYVVAKSPTNPSPTVTPHVAPSRHHELRGPLPSGRAALPPSAPRRLHLHHQHRPEPRRDGLPGRRVQVHPVRLLHPGHAEGVDAHAPGQAHALPRGAHRHRRDQVGEVRPTPSPTRHFCCSVK